MNLGALASASMLVALAEDDPGERQVLSAWLREAGYQCHAFDRSEALLHVAAVDDFDALVVGHLQGTRSAEVVAHVRRRQRRWVPILCVGQGRGESDVVTALRQGADDYMTKPIRRLELAARIEAMARRSRLRPQPRPALKVDVFSIDLEARTVRRRSQPVLLTTKDFEVAVLFLSNIGRLLSRRQIQEWVWGLADPSGSRTLDTHVCRIRNKLKLIPEYGWELAAVYSFGYRLVHLGSRNAEVAMLSDIAAERHLGDRSGGAEASPML